MSPVPVYLVGEGPNDIGDLSGPPPYRAGREGFFQPILKTMFASRELAFDGLKLTSLPRLDRRPQTAHALQARNAERALALATTAQARVLVFSCDLDKSSGTSASHVERRRRLEALRDSVDRGFQATIAVNPRAREVRTAIAIPCRMIEAWALADRRALAGLLQKSPGELNYGSVEALWGTDKAGSNHPKRIWQQVCGGRVQFADIGAVASPAALSEACPLSFPPFRCDVEAARDAVADGDA